MQALLKTFAITALLSATAIAQVTLPPHTGVYNGFTRGYNFIANTGFVINQLELPLDAYQAGDTASFLVRVNGAVALYNTGGTTNPLPISPIPVLPGDSVDILGNWSPAVTGNFTAHNSYSASFTLPGYATMIEGVAHNLRRAGWQWDIGAPGYGGTYLAPTSGQLGRIFIYTAPLAGTIATNTTLGQGCYRQYASFYENFATAPTFDLANSALTLTATGGGYVVTSGGTYNPVGSLGTPTALALTDDSQIAAGTLGLVVGSNGWVALGAGNSNSFTPTVATLLSNPSSAFYCWHDMNPAAVGSGLVQYEESGTMAQVTFDGVFNFAGTGPADANFLQFQVDTSTGNVVIAWQTMSALGNGFLVGYSPGGASQDPGNSNLSDVRLGLSTIQTFTTDVLPLTLAATSRPVTGTNWNLQVGNSALLDLIILGLSDPMIPDLFFLGLPGCGLRANLDLLNVGSTLSVGIPANPTLVGQSLYANGASLSPGANPFGAITSNGIQGTIGDV